MILVHGYADSRLEVGKQAEQNEGQPDNPWYWQGTYSDNIELYDVKAALEAAALDAGVQMQVKFANWDGRSKIEDAVASLDPQATGKYSLIDLLNEYATGSGTCDLVGHSTGDALIGYVLDKYADSTTRWNIGTVFVAGGAGGGTEAAGWSVYFGNKDPVVEQLFPAVMRTLYNHNMRGQFSAVPNIRFVGAGTGTDLAHQSWDPILGDPHNSIPYGQGALLCRTRNDGLVPFHSQGGVSTYVNGKQPGEDAYGIKQNSGLERGQLNLGSGPAQRWLPPDSYVDVPLFDGYQVQMLDDGFLYNHSDEVGRLAEWITRYKHDPSPWYSSTGTGDTPRVMSPMLTVAAVPGSTLPQLFYRGTDGGIFSRWLQPDTTWSGEQDLGETANGLITPAMVPGTSILQVFYRGPDSSVRSIWRDPDTKTWSTKEQDLYGILTSDITATAVPGTGILQLFYRGKDMAIYSRWRGSNGGWSGEQLIPAKPSSWKLTSDITAIAVPGTNALQLFYSVQTASGPGSSIWTVQRPAVGPWTTPISLGAPVTSSIAAAVVPGSDVIQLFYRGTDYALWTIWSTPGGGWSHPESLGGVLTSDVTAVTVPGTDILQVLYRGQDQGAWALSRDANGAWSPPQSLGGDLTSDITAFATPVNPNIPYSGGLQVFYRSDDDGIRARSLDMASMTWSGEQYVGGILS